MEEWVLVLEGLQELELDECVDEWLDDVGLEELGELDERVEEWVLEGLVELELEDLVVVVCSVEEDLEELDDFVEVELCVLDLVDEMQLVVSTIVISSKYTDFSSETPYPQSDWRSI